MVWGTLIATSSFSGSGRAIVASLRCAPASGTRRRGRIVPGAILRERRSGVRRLHHQRRRCVMASNGAKYIFAGAAHHAGPGGRRFRGGLFRRTPLEGAWEALSVGLPPDVEARAFAIHPREPDVIY